jgi:hypothetical protein
MSIDELLLRQPHHLHFCTVCTLLLVHYTNPVPLSVLQMSSLTAGLLPTRATALLPPFKLQCFISINQHHNTGEDVMYEDRQVSGDVWADAVICCAAAGCWLLLGMAH